MSLNDGVTRILNLGTQGDQAAELEKLRRNITVLFTDIKGSTAYFEKYGDSAGLLMVHHCNTLLGKVVESHGGRVIKTIGDSVMASFEDHAEAVAAAIEMQEAITAANLAKPPADRITIRIGINHGLGFVKSNDVFGDVVNMASRVESAASPEQILISDTLHQAVAGSGRFRFRPAGRFSPPRRQLFHSHLCIIFINNVIHTDMISYINGLASENFALRVKYLWKLLKKSQALSEASTYLREHKCGDPSRSLP